MKHYHPEEPTERLSKLSNSQLHQLLTDYRFVYAVFNQIGGRAKTRIKTLQSILAKRGSDMTGLMTQPYEPSDLRRPVTGKGVSEHAIVRYLERVKGIDMGEVEKEILERVANGTSYFNGAVVVDDANISYIMREDGLVKSVMPHEWLEEADHIAAEQSMKIEKRKRKDAHFRGLAAAGLDTSPAARSDRA